MFLGFVCEIDVFEVMKSLVLIDLLMVIMVRWCVCKVWCKFGVFEDGVVCFDMDIEWLILFGL